MKRGSSTCCRERKRDEWIYKAIIQAVPESVEKGWESST